MVLYCSSSVVLLSLEIFIIFPTLFSSFFLYFIPFTGLDIQKLSLPPEISRTTATEDPKTVLNHHQHQHQHQHGSCGCNHNSNANTSTTKSLKTPSAGLGCGSSAPSNSGTSLPAGNAEDLF